MGTSLSASIDLALDAQGAFDALAEEISLALKNAGLTLTFGSTGQVADGAGTVGRVVAWEPGRRISLRWNRAEWGNPEGAHVELRLDPIDGKYHWRGTVFGTLPDDVLKRPEALLTANGRTAAARLTERSPQGGYSVTGMGAPPFA